MVLGFGELEEDDQPPEEIWLNDEALIDHFDDLKRRRSSRESGDEEIPGAEWQQNEITKGLRR